MAIWQIKDFEEAPMLIDGNYCGFFAGSFFADADGEIVEIDVKVEFGPMAGKTIRLSDPRGRGNAQFTALKAGLELVYANELRELRQEIENRAEASYRLEAVA